MNGVINIRATPAANKEYAIALIVVLYEFAFAAMEEEFMFVIDCCIIKL
jgi:hypothetical protein